MKGKAHLEESSNLNLIVLIIDSQKNIGRTILNDTGSIQLSKSKLFKTAGQLSSVFYIYKQINNKGKKKMEGD